MRPGNLEGLRLLTNMQEDEKNLFTLIIAGQPKLTQMLRDPRRANFYQRIGVFCNLEPMDSAEVVQSYIQHRLAMAGCAARIFDSSGVEAVFTRSKGVPRLVNRLCKLSMKAAETNQLTVISDGLVNQIADRFAPLESGSKTAAERKSLVRVPAAKKAEIKKFPRAVEEEQAEIEEAHSPVIQPAPRPAPMPAENPVMTPAEVPAVAAASAGSEVSDVIHGHERKKIRLMGVTQQSIYQLKDLKTSRDKLRYAGFLAARELKIHPERFEGIDSDPVRIWDDLRRAIIAAV